MSAEKKGEPRSTRLRPSVEAMVREVLGKTGLSRADLYEFALVLACPVAGQNPATALHILVGHPSQ